MAKSKKKNFKLTAETADKHVLYEAAVQCPEANLHFVKGVFEEHRKREPYFLKEDFCGTSKLSCEWVTWHQENESWGIDLDLDVLEWGRREHLSKLGPAAKRVHLVQDNVLSAITPPVDVTVAFNFSYWIFKDRDSLRDYFKQVYKSLNNVGMFVGDFFGGHKAPTEIIEKQRVTGKLDHLGNKIPRFSYLWEQARFNPINHDLLCHIHFEFQDGSEIKHAYSYDWRLWSLPEVKEIMLEAGFASVDIYTHGWMESGESDDTYVKTTEFENEEAWLAYIVGLK